MKSLSLKSATKDAVRIFQFEMWARFYFIKQDGDTMRIEIPEDVVNRIKEELPIVEGLTELMNEREVNAQSSHDNVCSHIAGHLDGAKYDDSVMPRVFDSPQFKIEMYVFNLWLKMHEPYIIEEPLFFTEWEEMYAEWNKLDEVKEYRDKLVQSGGAPDEPACKTAQ